MSTPEQRPGPIQAPRGEYSWWTCSTAKIMLASVFFPIPRNPNAEVFWFLTWNRRFLCDCNLNVFAGQPMSPVRCCLEGDHVVRLAEKGGCRVNCEPSIRSTLLLLLSDLNLP